jgi:hypothetical protein
MTLDSQELILTLILVVFAVVGIYATSAGPKLFQRRRRP